MTARTPRRGFVARPAEGAASAETWVKAADTPASRAGDAAHFTARLTIDVTPELRGRIKVSAFRRGVTVADMLRDLLAREFPTTEGDPT
jgi:formylmethanofuran:tetrahydromethanopterin formyltransferase